MKNYPDYVDRKYESLNMDQLVKMISTIVEKNVDRLSEDELYDVFTACMEIVIKKDLMVEVDVSESMERIAKFVKDVIIEKMKESSHQIDCHKEEKRWTTGLMVEVASYKHLGIPYPEEAFGIGESSKFSYGDLKFIGSRVGAKGSSWGLLSTPNMEESRPQIFGVRAPYDISKVYLLGMAMPDVIQRFTKRILLKDKNMKNKGGFYGLHLLERIPSAEILTRDFPHRGSIEGMFK